MNKIFTFILLFFVPFFNIAQESTDCACCQPEYHQFDFWIGNWEVFNNNGEKVGENFIDKLEDNCIINENWVGVKGGTGKSYNYYDPSDSTWNQLWISNSGNILKLKGQAQQNKMVLKSEVSEGENGDYYNQITWTKNPDGSVTQLWEIYDPKGTLISTAFNGIYRKKQSD